MNENIYNAKKSEYDNRDFIYENLIKLNNSSLPIMTDYRHQMLPVRNQGNQGTCYAQSAACMKEWQEFKDYNLNEYLSPQFFYNNRNYMNDDNLSNDGDNGMTGRDVMRILKNVGICKETEYKYDNMNRNDNCDDIPEWIKINASKHLIKSYAKVNSINGLRDNLYFNGPCLIAFPVYGDKNNNMNSPMWKKLNDDDKSMGGHAMTVVGYNDNEQHFIIRNSWGPSWGDKGYCYYKYENWDSHWECWTTVDMDTIYSTEDDDVSINSNDIDDDSNDKDDDVSINSIDIDDKDDVDDKSNEDNDNYIKINPGIYQVYIDNNKVRNCYLNSNFDNFIFENRLYEWKDNIYRHEFNYNDYVLVDRMVDDGYIILTCDHTYITIYPFEDNYSDDEDFPDDKKNRSCPGCTIS
jgi:C1A family cysteine protease